MKQRWITPTVAILTALLAAAAPAVAGLYVEQSVVSSGEGPGMEMHVRGWADGDRVRVEYLESNNPTMPAGSYLLTRDGGQTVYLIDPQEQTYSVWDLNEVFAMIGQLSEATGGMMQLEFRDPVSESLGSQPGDAILGYGTTHRTWRSGFTMDMKLAMMSAMDHSNRVETTTAAWITDEIDYPALGIWFTANPPTTGDPQLDEVLIANMGRLDGMVLKLEQNTVTTNKKGKTASSSMRMEVTTLRQEPVDDSRFVMPVGYTEKPLIPSMDEVMRAQEGQGPEVGEEDQGPMKALRGLLRGRKNDG